MHPNIGNGEIKLQRNKYPAQICKEKIVHALILFLVDDRTVTLWGVCFAFY